MSIWATIDQTIHDLRAELGSIQTTTSKLDVALEERLEKPRQIRAAQEVLHAAGIGQLEVVKRANEPGETSVEIDGQVCIAEGAIKTVVIGPGGMLHRPIGQPSN